MIPHLTANTLGDFAYWILSDYTTQIETQLEDEEMSNNEYADILGLSPSRVSQVLNSPGNLTMGNVVKYARALGKKVAIVLYDDADPENKKGPISADVFMQCWQKLGQPRDQFDLQDIKAWIVRNGESVTKSTTTQQNLPLIVLGTARSSAKMTRIFERRYA